MMYCIVCEDAYGKLKVVDTCPPPEGSIKLYTQDQLEEARKLGMQQERALWNLSTSTQEIMDTHPVNELTDEEYAGIGLHLFRIGEATSIKDGIRLAKLIVELTNIKKG